MQVEIDEEGSVVWKDAEVRQVMLNRFYVCVDHDEDFIESYGGATLQTTEQHTTHYSLLMPHHTHHPPHTTHHSLPTSQ